MKNMWIRTIIAVIAAEALPILALVGMIAVMGSGDAAADQELAVSLGQWVGPIGGAIATFLMAAWAMRPLASGRLLYGALVGALVAGLDASIIFASGEAIQTLFIISWTGRIVAGLVAAMLFQPRQ